MPAKSAKKAKGAKKKANVDALNRKLQAAILADDEEGARAAVERGADVDALMASGYFNENVAPLHHVAALGNHHMARVLVERLGANLEVVGPDGWTAMHCASATGKTETLKTLAQLGANIDKDDNSRVTPLLLASWADHTPVVIALLALGADPSIASTRVVDDIPSGSTPLSIAQAKGHADIVRILSGKPKSAKEAHVEALNRKLQAAILVDDEVGVRAAVKRGAKVDGVMATGYFKEHTAPLHEAAFKGTSSMARVLVEELGSNVDMVEPILGSTPMHFASTTGNTEMIKTLAQLGANIDKQNNVGATPLLWASLRGEASAVIALLALGADPSITTTRATPGGHIPAGATPLSTAQAEGHADIVRLLSNKAGKGADKTTTRATYDPHQYQNPHPDDALGKPKKGKGNDANTHTCSYAACGKVGAKANCGRCKRAWYCNATCQKADWQRHKKGCRTTVAAAARAATRAREETAAREAAKKAKGAAAETEEEPSSKCVICIGPLVDPVPLPCGHAYCRECIGGVRTKGDSQTCPLCRAVLPPGVEGLFDLAMRAYRRMAGRVRRGEAVWGALEGESVEEMEEAVAMLVEAVAQGHVGSMGLLAEVYEGGHGVERDEAKAAELRKKVEEG
jgi:ankyrin repeat protein